MPPNFFKSFADAFGAAQSESRGFANQLLLFDLQRKAAAARQQVANEQADARAERANTQALARLEIQRKNQIGQLQEQARLKQVSRDRLLPPGLQRFVAQRFGVDITTPGGEGLMTGTPRPFPITFGELTGFESAAKAFPRAKEKPIGSPFDQNERRITALKKIKGLNETQQAELTARLARRTKFNELKSTATGPKSKLGELFADLRVATAPGSKDPALARAIRSEIRKRGEGSLRKVLISAESSIIGGKPEEVPAWLRHLTLTQIRGHAQNPFTTMLLQSGALRSQRTRAGKKAELTVNDMINRTPPSLSGSARVQQTIKAIKGPNVTLQNLRDTDDAVNKSDLSDREKEQIRTAIIRRMRQLRPKGQGGAEGRF